MLSFSVSFSSSFKSCCLHSRRTFFHSHTIPLSSSLLSSQTTTKFFNKQTIHSYFSTTTNPTNPTNSSNTHPITSPSSPSPTSILTKKEHNLEVIPQPRATIRTNEKNFTLPTSVRYTKRKPVKWESLDNKISPELMNAITSLGFKQMTQIQARTIPFALKHHNIAGSDVTGTGKTLAYLIPFIHRIQTLRGKDLPAATKNVCSPLGLIVVPTRELAEQIHVHLRLLTQNLPQIKSAAVFGGVSDLSQSKEINSLKDNNGYLDILIATPGRLIQLVKSNVLNLAKVGVVVLDECDRILSMGFFPDIKEVFSLLPKPNKRADPDGMQVMLYSATLTPDLQDVITRFAPHRVMVNLNEQQHTPKSIEHIFYLVNHRRKHALLTYLLRRKGSLKDKQMLVFVRTQQRAERLVELLNKDKIEAGVIHKEKSVAQRRDVVQSFREGSIKVLIATDVLARGIDIGGLSIVINYDVPNIPQDYVHRVGRTGRQFQEGKAITFVNKAPQILTVGKQTTELNEQHYVKDIANFASIKPNYRKVPGPWKDEDIENEEDENEKQKAEQAVAKILVSREVINMDKDGYLRPRVFPAKKKKEKEGIDSNDKKEQQLATEGLKGIHIGKNGLIDELPPLRNFQEGRYEDLMQKFEKKRAIKKGVYFPEVFPQWKKKLKAKA